MNKTELIDAIAKEADISKAAAGRALDAAVSGATCAKKRQYGDLGWLRDVLCWETRRA